MVISVRAVLLTLFCAFIFSCKQTQTSNKSSPVPYDTIAELTQLIEKHPDNSDYLYKRSYQYFRNRQTNLALADLDRAIVIEPKNNSYYHMRGYYKYVVGNLDEALKDFNQASYLASPNPETYFQIGNIAALKGDYQQSLKPYDHAIKLDPNDPQYFFAKAFALRNLKRTDEAVNEALKSLNIDSVFQKSLNLLFEIYLNDLNDTDRAAFYNQMMVKAYPKNELGYFNTGLLFYNLYQRNSLSDPKEAQKNIRQAVSAYDKAISLRPDYSIAYYQRGYMHFKIGNNEKALEDFRKTTDLDPKNEQAFFMMGSVYESYKENVKALECYRKALSLRPDWQDAQRAVNELK